jgi:hypothetical protein
MAFLILPFVVVFFFMGLSAQAWQLSQSVQGAGIAGQMDTRATVTAQQAEMFASACISNAIASSGLISTSIVVTLPIGVNLPNNALCMTTPASGGGRNVYGYMLVAPGAIGQIQADSSEGVTWYRVSSAGVASNLATGEIVAVPSTIPIGNVVEWIQTTS